MRIRGALPGALPIGFYGSYKKNRTYSPGIDFMWVIALWNCSLWQIVVSLVADLRAVFERRLQECNLPAEWRLPSGWFNWRRKRFE
jgi:hypothetical protein